MNRFGILCWYRKMRENSIKTKKENPSSHISRQGSIDSECQRRLYLWWASFQPWLRNWRFFFFLFAVISGNQKQEIDIFYAFIFIRDDWTTRSIRRPSVWNSSNPILLHRYPVDVFPILFLFRCSHLFLILKKKKKRTTGPSLSIRNRVIVWGIDRTRDLRLFPAYRQCVIMLCVCVCLGPLTQPT